MPEVRVKICGLTRAEDARHAAAAGADYLGAILADGFSRSVAPEVARDFAAPGGPALVAVLVNPTVESAVARAQAARASILQLQGDEPPELVAELRERTGLGVWKTVRPRSAEELRAGVERYAGHADGLHLEGWHPQHRGGAGALLDWDMVARIRDELPASLLLVAAGGLTPETVPAAIEALRPDIVDVSSGVETAPGRKDTRKVEAFIRAARGVRTSASAERRP